MHPHPLHVLRSILEQEQALFGSFLPLGLPPFDDVPEPDTLVQRRKAGIPTERRTPDADVLPILTPKTTPQSTEEPVVPMANFNLFGQQVDPTEDPSLPPWERIQALIPSESPLHTMTTLDEVADFVNNTVLIPLDEARLNAVMGVGNPNADLVVIGEAPGADEDKQGEPFVGRAGQLLNKILAAIHFNREDVYITNILKSRPPNNRDPLPAEVEAHIPILYKQLTLIKPLLILCVGRTAGNALLGRRSSLAVLRNTFHDYYGIPMMITYHPAALLRNPQWKRPTWEDVKLLRTRYDQLLKEKQARV
ncbi:MAG: uracil-DNA glycosylase [Rhodothermales bacterium]